MSPENPPRIELVSFQSHQAGIMAVRQAVFVKELGIDPQLEWDGKDAGARYAIAIAGTEIIGVGRLLADGKIGRIAILAEWRGQGTGARIIQCLVEAATALGHESVYLSSQLGAAPFYEKLGFIKTGGVFMAAGIAHQRMTLLLPSRAALI